jgi:hypothetical protein
MYSREMPRKLLSSNDALPGWEPFDSKVRKTLDPSPENPEVSIIVTADSDAVPISVRDRDGRLPTWQKRYPLDRHLILDDIRKEFGV